MNEDILERIQAKHTKNKLKYKKKGDPYLSFSIKKNKLHLIDGKPIIKSFKPKKVSPLFGEVK